MSRYRTVVVKIATYSITINQWLVTGCKSYTSAAAAAAADSSSGARMRNRQSASANASCNSDFGNCRTRLECFELSSLLKKCLILEEPEIRIWLLISKRYPFFYFYFHYFIFRIKYKKMYVFTFSLFTLYTGISKNIRFNTPGYTDFPLKFSFRCLLEPQNNKSQECRHCSLLKSFTISSLKSENILIPTSY